MTSRQCTRFTASGDRCQKATTNESGWCGQCLGATRPGSANAADADTDHDIDMGDYEEGEQSHDIPTPTFKGIKHPGITASHSQDPEVLARLADSRDQTVLLCLAENQHIGLGTLNRLIRDPYPPVRYAAIQNPALEEYGLTSGQTFETLANDRDMGIRRFVAGHAQTSTALLRQLAKDTDSLVHNVARAELDKRDQPREINALDAWQGNILATESIIQTARDTYEGDIEEWDTETQKQVGQSSHETRKHSNWIAFCGITNSVQDSEVMADLRAAAKHPSVFIERAPEIIQKAIDEIALRSRFTVAPNQTYPTVVADWDDRRHLVIRMKTEWQNSETTPPQTQKLQRTYDLGFRADIRDQMTVDDPRQGV